MRTMFQASICACALLACASQASPLQPPDGCYVREEQDQEWHIRIAGKISMFGGVYVIAHDANGRTVCHGAVPRGEYSADKPFLFTVKADKITGDYRIKLLGHESDIIGIQLPLTDLPLEVYGGTQFSKSGTKKFVKVPDGTKDSLFLTFDVKRGFIPDPALDEIKWWEGVK